MRSYWPTSASYFSDISIAWDMAFGDLTHQPPLHEWRGGEEFDARNGGRLDSGGRGV